MMLITGSSGNLGKQLSVQFPDALKPSHSEFDITNRQKIEEFIEKSKPEVVIHAAALVDVRKCENDKELAWRTNFVGTSNIVDSLLKYSPNTYFVYISTACVFRGNRGNYSEEDIPDPVNFYGLTKHFGELIAKRIPNHLIIRTNFVPREKWKFEKAFTDRWGTYLFADQVVKVLKELVEKKTKGIVHITGERKMSMFELARITTPDVKPLTMDEFRKIDSLHLTQDMTLRTVRIQPFKIS